VALYSAAGLITPFLYGRRNRAVVLRRRLAVMVASSGVAAAAEITRARATATAK
jgi:hypothetical protein